MNIEQHKTNEASNDSSEVERTSRIKIKTKNRKHDIISTNIKSDTAEVPQSHGFIVRSRNNNTIVELQTRDAIFVTSQGRQSLASLKIPHLQERMSSFQNTRILLWLFDGIWLHIHFTIIKILTLNVLSSEPLTTRQLSACKHLKQKQTFWVKHVYRNHPCQRFL